MNKDDTLQVIVDHYEIDDPHCLLTEALSDAFDKGINQCKRIINDECDDLRNSISQLERDKDDWESEIEDYNMVLRATYSIGEML